MFICAFCDESKSLKSEKSIIITLRRKQNEWMSDWLIETKTEEAEALNSS